MCSTLAHYTGGKGWGTMVYCCDICGEEVAEYLCDKDGIPTKMLYDNCESHECDR